MIFSIVIKACAVTVSALFLTLAVADDGHDHGAAKLTATRTASPRFTAQSDLFEAVGILGKDELVVYIDRTASNEPVVNATVELASAGIKLMGTFEPKLGQYHFDAKPFAAISEYPITLTIKAGSDTDLLTGELDVYGATTSATASTHLQTSNWQRTALWGSGGIVLALLLFVAIRRIFSSRRNRLGVAA